MKRLIVLLILMLIVVGCGPEPSSCTGTVIHKEYQEPAWGVGIGQNNRGTIGAVPMLKPGQYLVTVCVSDRDEVFSVEQDIYKGLVVGDTVACELSDDFFTCNFEED